MAFAAVLACNGSEQSHPVGASDPSAPGPVGAQGDAGGSTGGSDGLGEGGGTLLLDARAEDAQPDAAGDGTQGADAGGANGGSTADGDPSDAGSEATAVWSCAGDYAFGAPFTTSFFMDPTPPALASALTTIEGAGHPISFVLHVQDGALLGALSATTEGPGGKEAFLPDDVPLFAPAVPAFGSPPGVTSVDPQPNAVLRFEDQAGPVDIQIEHVVWRATQNSNCADMTISLQAVLPASQFSVILHLPTGEQTIGELITSSSESQPSVTPIGGPAPAPTPVEIALTFAGVPLDFDFDALEAPL